MAKRVSVGTGGMPTNPVQDSFERLGEAEQLRQQGQLDRAITICESLVRRYPDYWGAQHTLGLAYADKSNHQRALDCLVRAAMLNPKSWTTLTALSGVYLSLGAEKMAAQTLEQARRIGPEDANVLCTLGEIYRAEQEFELALDCYRQAVTLEPDLLLANLGYGSCNAEIGEDARAAEAFEGLIKRGLRRLEPLFELAALPSAVVSIDLFGEVEKALAGKPRINEELEISVAFTKAASLHANGHFAEAWQLIEPANRKLFRTRQKEYEALKATQQSFLDTLRNNLATTSKVSIQEAQFPISLFILGPSRSGKTTLEQLAGTLEGVKRGYENPIVLNSIRRTFQDAGLLTGKFFEHLPPQLLQMCHDAYVEELAQRSGQSKVFTNTNPVLIYDAARMATIFPNVRFVFVKRNLEDNIFRIYSREYDKGNSYAYDLTAARDHLLWYHQMMDVMAEKFPEIVRIVHYEKIVEKPGAILQMVAEFCGVAMKHSSLPKIGDDRGCAKPYHELMAAELAR